GYYLQTFLYALIMRKETEKGLLPGKDGEHSHLPVCPCLFYILSANDAQQYDPTLKLGREIIRDIREVADEYTEELRRIVTEIYDSTRPFTQTEQKKTHCEYCDFQRLCGLSCT
ncbi:MAG: PD-(D/E)XK nuclease family protein, partial [Bacteroidaceae bacterium]|nr:PD-(D/E)XK nuclease family protein [Bacteroidaceae bacterium]